ncbi:MAG: two-component sensor histidine kinase [Planctomycetaceae bacterium]|nr:two-component sensor histidine kinase [Planctomycetaceae bacterium]
MPTSAKSWELSAELITLQIRWFGLFVGFTLANTWAPPENRLFLNGILALGTVYAILDVVWHRRGDVFLARWPLFTSLMEAVFIGLLCHFDYGFQNSPFRFYYFLSLVVCAMRYSPRVTYSSLALHCFSLACLAVVEGASYESSVALLLLLVFLGWTTWASTALAALLRMTGDELSLLNTQLEGRIKRRTRELQESQALVVQQEKLAAFGLLAAGIAHEVGNPLAAISSLVQVMNRKPLEDEMHEKLALIDGQLRRIHRTLQELIQFSRPAVNEVVSCSVHQTIETALEIAKYYKRKKGKYIETHFAPDLPNIQFARDALTQVFLNLILNSLDATEEGGRIDITTETVDSSVRVIVQDNGHGIDEEARERLFQPYVTTKSTGTGLGLFVCHNILENSGGKIELVESTRAGTVFCVTLPLGTATAT